MGMTVLVVSGNDPRFFKRLKELNAFVVYIAEDVPLEMVLSVDLSIQHSLEEDWAGLLREIQLRLGRRPPDAVVTYLDRYVPLAAYLREQLNAGYGPSTAAASNCRDKYWMRKLLTDYHLPNAKYVVAGSPEEMMEGAKFIGFPVIVKPRSGVGGMGVRLCRSEEEIAAAAEAIRDVSDALPAFADGKSVLIEEYLPGTIFAVQTLTRRGKTEIVNIVETVIGPFPLFLELEHFSPPRLTQDERERMGQAAKKIIRVLGLDDCITHMQIALVGGDPILIEVNPRVPGGNLVDLTTWTTGIDLYRACVDLSVGLETTRCEPIAMFAQSRSISFASEGFLQYNPELQNFASVEDGVLVRMDVPSEEWVYACDHPEGGVYGRILVVGNDLKELHWKMKKTSDHLGAKVMEEMVKGVK